MKPSWKQVCDCGHDRDTHFEGKHNCLGVACDCPSYWDSLADTPRPKALPKRPAGHPRTCACYVCKQLPKAELTFEDDFAVDDEQTDPSGHLPFCPCPKCFP